MPDWLPYILAGFLFGVIIGLHVLILVKSGTLFTYYMAWLYRISKGRVGRPKGES